MSDIKVTGTPQTFGDGAIRNSKEGKGRFDLIPPDPFRLIVNRIIFLRDHRIELSISNDYIWKKVFNDENYIDTIILLTAREYGIKDKALGYTTDNSTTYDPEYADTGLWPMLHDLAIHFQKGAEIYGEHNCEKGIPIWSFRDSGLRHLSQYFNNEQDEPHLISAIWNFWMLIWSAMRLDEDFEKIREAKNDSREFDFEKINRKYYK